MSRMNGKGPEDKGERTGRGLGPCGKIPDNEAFQKLGKGLGLRRRSGGGNGKGRRLKSGLKEISN